MTPRPDRDGKLVVIVQRVWHAAARTAPAALGLALCGCAAFGAIAYKFSGSPDVPAQYTPAPEPMLVLVEKSDNPAEAQMDGQRIGRYVAAQLQEHGIGPQVDVGRLMDLRSSRPGPFRPISPADAGRAVGAKQVLYVDLTAFDADPALASEMVQGKVEARVRVIDAQTGQTRWPLDTTQGYPVSVATPYAQTGATVSPATIREQLNHKLSDKVARLFYKWSSDEVDGSEPPLQ